MKKGLILIILFSVLFDVSAQEFTTVEDTICYGSSYVWHDTTLTTTGEYEKTLQDINGDDSIVVLHLTVLPITYTTIDTTIIDGETYIWNEKAYKTTGNYVDTLQSVEGCDSIVTLNLEVLENNVMLTIQTIEQCADANVVELMIEWEGEIDSIGLIFVQDTIDTIVSGLRDTIVPVPVDGYLSIPYDSIRAGVYETNVIGYFCTNKVFEETISLTYLYPSSVLEQRWDDVICVLAGNYNGGYDFTAFLWYRDGSPLEGETGYYLHQPLEEGVVYSVLLTEADGTQLMTCPIVIEVEQPEISVEPTLVARRQPIRCYVPEEATLYVYDMTGNLLINKRLLQGESHMYMPQAMGIYMMKIVLQSNLEKNIKVVVL